MFKKAIFSFYLVFIIQNSCMAQALTLKGYLQKVQKLSNAYQALQHQTQSAKLQKKEGDFIYEPLFFFETKHNESNDDGNNMRNNVIPIRKRQTSSNLGFKKNHKYGIKTKVYYQLTRDNYYDNALNLEVSKALSTL